MRKFSLALFSFGLATSLVAAPAQRMPVIENLGVIPVHWEGLSSKQMGLERAREIVDRVFSQVVRESARFKVLDDALVKTYWDNSDGRMELAEQFELQAFSSLNVVVEDDVVRFYSRLLSPSLKSYLQESHSTSPGWLIDASEAQIREKLSDLVFALFNRLPIDMSVTSVQGRYVTFSGGHNQKVRLGGVYEIIRPFVSSVHPADGTWLKFQTRRKGKAKIIEVKSYSSVAELVTQTYEDAVAVGDGSRIKSLSARTKFRQRSEKSTFKSNEEDPVVLTPLYKEKKKRRPKMEIPEEEPTQPASEEMPQSENEDVEEREAEESADHSEYVPFVDVLEQYAADLRVGLGPRLWRVSGGGSAAAKFPIWLFNHIALEALTPWRPDFDLESDLGLDFGQTSDGSFMGFSLGTKAVYKLPFGMPGMPIKHYRLGGGASLTSLAVDQETFGGVDLLQLQFFGGAAGGASLFGSKLDWKSDFYIIPLGFGQVGYEGSKRTLSSVFGWGLRGDAFMVDQPKTFEYGAALDLGMIDWSSDDNLSLTDLKILFKLRYRF